MGQKKLKKDKNTKSVTVSKNGTITDDYETIKSLLNVYFELYEDSQLLISEYDNSFMLYAEQFGFTKLSILVNAFKRTKYTFIISCVSKKRLYVAEIYKK